MRIPVRVDFAGGWTDVHYFSASEGGAVVNAAIDQYVDGTAVDDGERVHLEYDMAVPKGAGLGTSAALDVAWLALTNGLMGLRTSAVELAEAAYRLEKGLGVEGGKQDQYASVFAGFNHLRFGAEDEPAQVEPLRPRPSVVRTLEERLILCYTGTAHHSGALHGRVWTPYLEGDVRIAGALRRIAASVAPTRDALLAGDLEALAELLTVNREAARELFAGLVTPAMDRFFEVASAAGAIGSKACGAGGGGCLLFLCAGERREAVEKALRDERGVVLPFRFEAVSRWGEHADVGDERLA